MKNLVSIILVLTFCAHSAAQTVYVTNPYVFSPKISNNPPSDPDADAYFSALQARGIIPDEIKAAAIEAFIFSMKESGLWQTSTGIYYPVWSNASANAINMKQPGTYNITWFGTAPHTSNGVGFDKYNTYAYGNTGIPITAIAQNSIAISYYSQTNDGCTDCYEIGAYSGIRGVTMMLLAGATNGDVALNHAGSSISFGNTTTSTTGLFTASRTSSTSVVAFRGGSQTGSVSATSGARTTTQIFLGAANFGSPSSYTTRKMSYARIGGGITSMQEFLHNQYVEALHDAFGIGKQ